MPAAPIPPTFSRPEPEEEPIVVLLDPDVVVWRFDQLVHAGYDHEAAQLVADSGADLHVACDLLEHGATVGEALRILL